MAMPITQKEFVSIFKFVRKSYGYFNLACKEQEDLVQQSRYFFKLLEADPSLTQFFTSNIPTNPRVRSLESDPDFFTENLRSLKHELLPMLCVVETTRDANIETAYPLYIKFFKVIDNLPAEEGDLLSVDVILAAPSIATLLARTTANQEKFLNEACPRIKRFFNFCNQLGDWGYEIKNTLPLDPCLKYPAFHLCPQNRDKRSVPMQTKPAPMPTQPQNLNMPQWEMFPERVNLPPKEARTMVVVKGFDAPTKQLKHS